jgi:hypothetical protein
MMIFDLFLKRSLNVVVILFLLSHLVLKLKLSSKLIICAKFALTAISKS